MQRSLAIVIPAGGGGTRLWPRSRQNTPKQFLDIVTPGRTMLQETVDRVVPQLITPDHLFVITNERHAALVHKQLPDVPAENIIGEPVGRDSAAAIGLMAALLERKLGDDVIMAVLPADHVILDPGAFRAAIEAAAPKANEGYLVTLGIPPTGPDTGFGYIKRGEKLISGVPDIYAVDEFKEKPSKHVAETYIKSGAYFWNAGMYIAKVSTFRTLYKTFLPNMEDQFAALVGAVGESDQKEKFKKIFPDIQKISIDYGIAEKADKVAVVSAEIGWNDVGSWTRLAEVLAETANEDGIITSGHHIGIDTTDTLIYSEKLVTTIGVDGLIIVDTPDGLLIAKKSRSEDVKQIVDQLKAEGKEKFL
jgi:mannose-1-phosphate guanylyltransferase